MTGCKRVRVGYSPGEEPRGNGEGLATGWAGQIQWLEIDGERIDGFAEVSVSAPALAPVMCTVVFSPSIVEFVEVPRFPGGES